MNRTLKATALAFAIAGAAAFSAQAADTVVTFDPGVVAYGYSDGLGSGPSTSRSIARPRALGTTNIATTAIPTRAGAARW